MPEYRAELDRINDRVVDLMLPFSDGWYVDAGFRGSASIKRVLPVMCPDLSYLTLDVQEGSSAQRLWMETVLDGQHGAEKERVFRALLEYCKMDTWAMVRILRELRRILGLT